MMWVMTSTLDKNCRQALLKSSVYQCVFFDSAKKVKKKKDEYKLDTLKAK